MRNGERAMANAMANAMRRAPEEYEPSHDVVALSSSNASSNEGGNFENKRLHARRRSSSVVDRPGVDRPGVDRAGARRGRPGAHRIETRASEREGNV